MSVFAVGDTHRLTIGLHSYKIYILAIVDECQVVYRWYGRRKQWWHYSVQHEDFLQLEIERTKKREDL